MSDFRIERSVELPENPDRYVQQSENAEKAQAALAQFQNAAPGQKLVEAVVPSVVVRYSEVEFEVGSDEKPLKIKMTRPRFATQMRAKRILSKESFADPMQGAVAEQEVRVFLHVSEINGELIERPSNMIEYESLLQRLGPEGCDAVMIQFQESFPPITNSEIRNVKKS